MEKKKNEEREGRRKVGVMDLTVHTFFKIFCFVNHSGGF